MASSKRVFCTLCVVGIVYISSDSYGVKLEDGNKFGVPERRARDIDSDAASAAHASKRCRKELAHASEQQLVVPDADEIEGDVLGDARGGALPIPCAVPALARASEGTMTRYPYGTEDPYALVELIASTQVHAQKFCADQMPALSARVSFAKSGVTGDSSTRDKKLMQFLAANEHMSPFEHQSATFKVVLPLIVARQWMRHRTQSYNEISMRYTDDPVGKLHMPQRWRKQASVNRQASDGSVDDPEECTKILERSYRCAIEAYRQLLAKGVCREQARLVVPVGNYTEFYATANLRNWAAWYKLRIAKDAQWEIRQYARSIGELLDILWPDSWGVLKARACAR